MSEAFERPGLVGWGSVSVMATRAEDLRREALALSDVEHADLAAELLVSLEAPAEQDASVTESDWAEEIERRAATGAGRRCRHPTVVDGAPAGR